MGASAPLSNRSALFDDILKNNQFPLMVVPGNSVAIAGGALLRRRREQGGRGSKEDPPRISPRRTPPRRGREVTLRDYWLNRFFYQMQQPDLRQRYIADPEAVMSEYRLSDAAKAAVRDQDVAYLSPRTNPYLLRYYFGYMGVPDPVFIAKVRACAAPDQGDAHG